MSDIAAFAQKFALLGSKVRGLIIESSSDESNVPRIVMNLMKGRNLSFDG
jgi:hypothetical protein